MQHNPPPRSEIDVALERIRNFIRIGKRIRHDRGRSAQDLIDLDMTGHQRDAIIAGLKLFNFSHCPAGELGAGKVYVFGDDLHGIEIYIKLGNLTEEHVGVSPVRCISFHKADQPLNYPYRDSGPPPPRTKRHDG